MVPVCRLKLMAELCLWICVADAQLCPQLYMGELVSCFLCLSVSSTFYVMKSFFLWRRVASAVVLCS